MRKGFMLLSALLVAGAIPSIAMAAAPTLSKPTTSKEDAWKAFINEVRAQLMKKRIVPEIYP